MSTIARRSEHSPELEAPDADGRAPTATLADFDPNDYREYLVDCEVTEAEKDQLLRLLWNIMCSFVYLGWGVDAVSLVFQTTSPSPANEASFEGCERPAPSATSAR